MYEPHPDHPSAGDHHGPIRNLFRRTHRWSRVHRDEDELLLEGSDDHVAHVFFSTLPDDMGLYGKPMARNAQIWSHDARLILDGPGADRDAIKRAMHQVCAGGLFGYRFQYPPMRVGRHAVYWHRPLVAYYSSADRAPRVLFDMPAGCLTAYPIEKPGETPNFSRPVELWPRFLRREPRLAAIELFLSAADHRPNQTILNVRKLLDTWELLGQRPLPRSFARQLLTLPREETLEAWLERLPEHTAETERTGRLVDSLNGVLEPANASPLTTHDSPLTFRHTARRSFETAYWNTITSLCQRKYRYKNNADIVHDPVTEALAAHHHRDLEALGNHLLEYYAGVIARSGVKKGALAGELPFLWETDFDFAWYGGWASNQLRRTHERDLFVVIPGRDRRRAVILADHYDTAYMEDHYYKEKGAHLPATGADDNHSATAALMLAAPIYLELSRAGKLGCDIWLVHLTGEEFPADCLGARHLCQALVDKKAVLHTPQGQEHDLSGTRVQGVYVMDMIAHNNDRDRDVFQIAPGTSRESMWLAYQAHLANRMWNDRTEIWNRSGARRQRGRGKRSRDGRRIPGSALHPKLSGEIRPHYAPRSTLYNTDGEIFSDAGVPVVLFMENYDINRQGYHDSHDTMENIDLDYGSALAAIAIESAARAATEEPM
jgi:hypothetical protein